MAVPALAQKCISLLNSIIEISDQAVAFGPEVRAMRNKLAELRSLFGEFAVKSNWEENHFCILEAIQAAMRRYSVVASACSLQGPIQTLLTADELLHELVDSCLGVQREVERLYSERIPTLVLAQAKMVSAQLNSTTLNFEALRRLHNLRYKLHEEAERVRLGAAEGSTFTSLMTHITTGCTSEQLSSDVAFLQKRLSEALAAQHLVEAHFLKLATSALEAQSSATAGITQPATQPHAGLPSAMGSSETSSPRRQCTKLGSEQQPNPADVDRAMAKLTCNSATPAERHAALELLCDNLEGTNEAVAALTEASLGVVFRIVACSDLKLRAAALRLLVAVVAFEPSFAGHLVAARGVPVLVHILGSYLDEARRRQDVKAELPSANGAAAVTISIGSTTSPLSRKGQAAYGRNKSAASPLKQRAAMPAPVVVQSASEVFSSSGPDAVMCIHAITLLRYVFQAHMAEIFSAGAIPILCRVAAVPAAGSVPSAAAAALADAAADGNAAVQMLQNRLLVTLADMIRSDRPADVAVAEACIAALLKHTFRLAETSDGTAVQLATEMGRACDAASVTVLLDTASNRLSDGAVPGSSTWSCNTVRQSVFQLLPYCLHSTENRAALLRHDTAMRLLLLGAANGDATAAATFKRLAVDEVSVTAVARQLSQGLVSIGTQHGSSRQVAALALCLADVVRPTSRDRSATRWATDACGEVQQCGTLPTIMNLLASPDLSCRAAGLACLHALAVYGNHTTRAALGECGALVSLVDAVKLEGQPLPDALQPPICTPHNMGQAAAEALAALASTTETARRDICMQLCAFLSSSSAPLASSACLALSLLVDAAPAAGMVLASQGVMPNLVAHIARAEPGRAPSASAHKRDSPQADTRQALLQTRATQLLFTLCRGGGDTVDAAVAAGAASALFQRAALAPDITLRVQAAAALGPMLKKSAPARESVGVREGVYTLLKVAHEAHPNTPLLEEALTALAAQAAFHGPSRLEALRELRQMMIRGSGREMAAAAIVVARMSSGPAGREAVLAEDFVDPLVKLLTTGDVRAKTAAATAIRHLAVPATMQLPKCAALPAGGLIRPRVVLVRAGAVPALLALLRSSAGDSAGASQSPPRGTTSNDMTPVVCAAEALESLAGGEEGVQAIRATGGTEVLKDIVARGKRRLVPAAAMQAASSTLLQCV